MKENICTIPINDIFKDTDGCPICRMYKMLEEQYVEYITGDAMMAPDVRVITNKIGFCKEHYHKMLVQGPKLPNALLIQTHLDEIRENILPKSNKSGLNKKDALKIDELKNSCYVCDRIEKDIYHLLKTVFVQFEIDQSFRELYKNQEYICLDHYKMIMEYADSKDGINKKAKEDFYIATNELVKNKINKLYDDVTKLTTMYDYRNQGKDFSDCKYAVEEAISFLTSENI